MTASTLRPGDVVKNHYLSPFQVVRVERYPGYVRVVDTTGVVMRFSPDDRFLRVKP